MLGWQLPDGTRLTTSDSPTENFHNYCKKNEYELTTEIHNINVSQTFTTCDSPVGNLATVNCLN